MFMRLLQAFIRPIISQLFKNRLQVKPLLNGDLIMQKAELEISNMHCSSCEKSISMLAEDMGVKVSSISAKSGKASIEALTKDSIQSFTKALGKEGHSVKRCVYG